MQCPYHVNLSCLYLRTLCHPPVTMGDPLTASRMCVSWQWLTNHCTCVCTHFIVCICTCVCMRMCVCACLHNIPLHVKPCSCRVTYNHQIIFFLWHLFLSHCRIRQRQSMPWMRMSIKKDKSLGAVPHMGTITWSCCLLSQVTHIKVSYWYCITERPTFVINFIYHWDMFGVLPQVAHECSSKEFIPWLQFRY